MKKNLFVGYEIVDNYARLAVFTSWTANTTPVQMMMQERGRKLEVSAVTEFNWATELDDEIAKSLARRAALKFDSFKAWLYNGEVQFDPKLLEYRTFFPIIISAVNVM